MSVPASLRTPGLSRRSLVGTAAALLAVRPARGADEPFSVSGHLVQGGVMIGRTRPSAPLMVDGALRGAASAAGWFVVGFDRDAPPLCEVAVDLGSGWLRRSLPVAALRYEVQRIDGLPDQMVTATDPAILKREAEDRQLKEAAFASRSPQDDFLSGFILPLEAPVRTSPFGVQRILNGAPKAPHYGVDLAAPAGTSIRAPGAGLVVLAAPDLYLDGGLTLIDHGQGLISMYLHQSRLDVAAGQRVRQGDLIGLVGMKGRATGPHLCWRLKWRDRNLDPSLLLA